VINVKLKILRKVLEEAINNIDAGNSNHSDDELDNKIIESAITFYFKDEDSGSTKTWNYFKTAN
jgi:hypothetical protein